MIWLVPVLLWLAGMVVAWTWILGDVIRQRKRRIRRNPGWIPSQQRRQ